jgi:hypothetical protein
VSLDNAIGIRIAGFSDFEPSPRTPPSDELFPDFSDLARWSGFDPPERATFPHFISLGVFGFHFGGEFDHDSQVIVAQGEVSVSHESIPLLPQIDILDLCT